MSSTNFSASQTLGHYSSISLRRGAELFVALFLAEVWAVAGSNLIDW